MKKCSEKLLALLISATLIITSVPIFAVAKGCADTEHKWSKWSEYSDTLDSRACADCGKTEYKYSDSCTVLSLNLIEETDDYIAVGAALERGSFIAIDIQVTCPGLRCMSIWETDSFIDFEKKARKLGETVVTNGNTNNGMYSISTMISYDCIGENFVEYRFEKNGTEISLDDIELTVRHYYVSDSEDASGNVSELLVETFSSFSSSEEHIHLMKSEYSNGIISTVCSGCGLEEYSYVSDGDAVFGINVVEDELFYTVLGVSLEAGSFNSVRFSLEFISDLFEDFVDIYKTEQFENFTEDVSAQGGNVTSRINMRTGQVWINSSVEYNIYSENIILFEIEKYDFRDIEESDVNIDFEYLTKSGETAEPDVIKNMSDSTQYTHIYAASEKIPAGCTADGLITYTCRCGAQFTRTVPAEGHSLTHFTTEPTCEQDGCEYDECTKCHEVFDYTVLPASGHGWSEWSAYSSDKETRTCPDCGKTELRYSVDTEAIFSLNVIEETDTYVDIGIGFNKGSFNAADVQPVLLSDKIGECTENEVLYLDEFSENVSENGGSCVYSLNPQNLKLSIGTTQKYEGNDKMLVRYRFNKLSPESVTEDDIGLIISSCGLYKNNQLRNVECLVAVMPYNKEGHTHLYHTEVIVHETCTEDGLMNYTCSCGDTFSAVIPAGHSIEHILNPAGCEHDGEEYDICTRCSEVFNYSFYPATGHSFEHVITNASCAEDGREYDICTNCEEIRNLTVTPAYGHDWGGWSYLIEPTCTDKGYKYRKCRTCGEAEGTAVEALGHFYVWCMASEADGSGNIRLEKKCTRCSNICDKVEIQADAVLYAYLSQDGEISADILGLDDSSLVYRFSSEDVVSVENGTVSALKPGTVYIISENANGDLAGLCRIDVEGIVAVNGSTVDYDRNLIYGLDVFSDDILSYVETTDSSLTVSCDDGMFATGSRVDLLKNGVVLDSYEIVIFGDVNGDGKYDGTDAVITNCIACGMLSKDDVGEAVYLASDCNHDGTTDSADVSILNDAGLLLTQIDQSKNYDELMETSSAFAEYVSLIDQGKTQNDTDEPTDVQPERNSFDWLISLIEKIIKIFTAVLNLLIK